MALQRSILQPQIHNSRSVTPSKSGMAVIRLGDGFVFKSRASTSVTSSAVVSQNLTASLFLTITLNLASQSHSHPQKHIL